MDAETVPEPYSFQRTGRAPTTILTVAIAWFFCGIAYTVLAANLWFIMLIMACTLPAIWDTLSNPTSGLIVENGSLQWFSGRVEAEVMHIEINHVRFDTRLDLTSRMSVVLHTGRKLRLPPESTPPLKDIVPALEAHGVSIQRHHFSIL